MVWATKDRIRNNLSKLLDRAGTGRVLPKRSVNPHFIMIGAVFRKYSSKVLFTEYDQMISALAPKSDNYELLFSAAFLLQAISWA